MPIDEPDVLDVEFRELPAAPRLATTPAARRKARSRQARRDAAAERRIGLQHLTFFRGYLEGLALAELADQYFEFGHDARKAAATRSWLVTSFVASAKKRQDFA
ncbi:integrase, partial [Burkholderia sp. Ac-20384]|nr:integrase [Burkholderia sp. Ac-20384]